MTHPAIEPEFNPEEYRPEGLRDWKVGDAVAWHVSAECPYKCEGCGVDFHQRGPQGEGTITTILLGRPTTRCSPDNANNCGARGNASYNHNYFIEVDALDYRNEGFWAAASELIPIPEGHGASTYVVSVDQGVGKDYTAYTNTQNQE